MKTGPSWNLSLPIFDITTLPVLSFFLGFAHIQLTVYETVVTCEIILWDLPHYFVVDICQNEVKCVTFVMSWKTDMILQVKDF